MKTRIAAAFACLTTMACAGEATPPRPAAPAASVTAPVKEAQLTTVSLTPDAERRLAIQTALVEEREVPRTRTLGGEIVAPSGTTLSITAPVAGTLQAGSIPSVGSTVTRGQTLFRLIPLLPAERDATVDVQNAMEIATARRDAARLKVQRAERLVRDGSGSRRALEEAQAELAVAEADFKAASDRVTLVSRSGASAAGFAIDAPDTAMVQNVHVRDGQAVAAGSVLVELARLTTVWVRVPIYAGDVDTIETSAPAQIQRLGDPNDAAGVTAQTIAAPPSANAATSGVDLYYSLANPNNRFKPGERVTVRLVRRDSQRGLVVPTAALLHDAYGGTWVYVARQAQVYARERVVVTDMSGSLAILSRGPQAGTRVVTDGAAELFGVEFGAGK